MVFWRKKPRNNGESPKERPKTVYGDVGNARRDNVRVTYAVLLLQYRKGLICLLIVMLQIIDRAAKDGKNKGVIFGQKANSRSGLFDPSAVKIVERPQSG